LPVWTAAVPIALTLALQGIVAAAIVLGYVIVYQLIENYWLAPRLSAKRLNSTAGSRLGPPSPAARCSGRWARSWRCPSPR